LINIFFWTDVKIFLTISKLNSMLEYEVDCVAFQLENDSIDSNFRRDDDSKHFDYGTQDDVSRHSDLVPSKEI
jgi:hypothetical protein